MLVTPSYCWTNFRSRKLVDRSVTIFFICYYLIIVLLLSDNLFCEGRLNERNNTNTIPASSDFISYYPTGDFKKLKCNSRLKDDPCLTSWSMLYGAQLVFKDTVEIPCGTCVVMTHPLLGTLELFQGLTIFGKLIIPNGIVLDVRTTSILVHGELIMESSKPIDGTPDITITWIDTPNHPLSFRPPSNGENSEDICGGKHYSCDMGRKPFIVAGGRLDIRGLPSSSMPTWVPIYDVDQSPIPTTEYRTYQQPLPGCPQDDILIHHDFSGSPILTFGGSYGSFFEWTTNGRLKVTNRTHAQHCPIIDLKHVRHCLQADKTYLLTAKVLLTKDDIVDQSDCARGGDDSACMKIYQARMSEKGLGRTTSIWKERRSFGSMLGEETTISVEFNFTSKQISEPNIYEILQLRGPGPGVDMEMIEFTLRAPPKEAFPEIENLCTDMVPINSDAELLGLSPYPFRTNNEDTHLSVVAEGSNHYFEVTGREFAVQNARRGNLRNAGITWDVPQSCFMKTHSKFTFKADIRMHSLSLVSAEWKIKGTRTGKKPVIESLATCPSSVGNWVNCYGEFKPSIELTKVDRLEVFLETDTSSYDIDYDVDNISFKRTTKGEGGFDRLILPNSVENVWNTGAELLITSHTSEWDGHSTRRVTSIENHDKEGYVSISLNEPIDRPITLGSNPFYATEVALLSRNIVFMGANGGHLTVLNTPNQAQLIQGVEFREFGSGGEVREAYPIYFDNCNDSSGSVVSKNSIRDSKRGCIVLDGTNNVLVEQNVALATKGHCFVVKTGKEIGNVFKSNLGAFCQEEDIDTTPATFWIGSPTNFWVDNVASGSEGFGFWFQPKDHTNDSYGTYSVESPHLMQLTQFTGNAAHSTHKESLKFTGYTPTQTASINNFKSYLNNRGHIDVSSSANIAAYNTFLDTPLASVPFPIMSDTTVVEVTQDEDISIDILNPEFENHGSFSNPTDVFNLQSSPSLAE
jgi:hypothetical protein